MESDEKGGMREVKKGRWGFPGRVGVSTNTWQWEWERHVLG